MAEHAVVIAGGGPTGLTLAGELALAGVDVALVERRTNQELAGSRAGGLHSRTIEIFDQRGIADRFLAEGQKVQAAGFAMNPVDISDLPTRHNYVLGLWQKHIERILANWVEQMAAKIYRGRASCGNAVGFGHPLRPWRGTPVARTTDARPRPDHSQGLAACLYTPARRTTGAPQPR